MERIYTPEQKKKLYILGIFTNGIPLACLGAIVYGLELDKYVAISLAI
jgi:orotate phosphoribosyltransferase-like protein